MATGIAANRLELLQIADAVAREKSIDKSVVIHAMEEAMQRAAKSRYGAENEIRVEIDPKTGETHISRYLHVVEKVENDKIEISLADARRRNPAAQVGDIIAELLPPIEFSRIATQAAKQVIVQKVRDAERERQYDEYKDRIGEIVHGTVKRVEFGSVVVDFGRAEGVVRRDEMIRANRSATAIVSAPTSTTCGARPGARRSFSRARIPNSWRACSRRKCPRFTTASSKSVRSRAIREAAPRSL